MPINYTLKDGRGQVRSFLLLDSLSGILRLNVAEREREREREIRLGKSL